MEKNHPHTNSDKTYTLHCHCIVQSVPALYPLVTEEGVIIKAGRYSATGFRPPKKKTGQKKKKKLKRKKKTLEMGGPSDNDTTPWSQCSLHKASQLFCLIEAEVAKHTHTHTHTREEMLRAFADDGERESRVALCCAVLCCAVPASQTPSNYDVTELLAQSSPSKPLLLLR